MYEIIAVIFMFINTVATMAWMRGCSHTDDWYSVPAITIALCIGIASGFIWPITLGFLVLIAVAYGIHRLFVAYFKRKYKDNSDV